MDWALIEVAATHPTDDGHPVLNEPFLYLFRDSDSVQSSSWRQSNCQTIQKRLYKTGRTIQTTCRSYNELQQCNLLRQRDEYASDGHIIFPTLTYSIAIRDATSFCNKGDSGSLIYKRDGNVVGWFYGANKRLEVWFFSLIADIFECGWSGSESRLHNDINLLMVGGQGWIKVAIIVKWARHSDHRVSGKITVFKLDRNGIPIVDQRQVCPKTFNHWSRHFHLLFVQQIFPEPSTNPDDQKICLQRGDVFGTSLLPGRNPRDPLYLKMANLRAKATKCLGFMGLTPA